MGVITEGQIIHGFEIVRIEDLGELKSRGVFARHQKTGCEVYHIVSDDEENLFAYAFMTPPEDSTGVAHILEHSVLCGSQSYPLKDPFLVLAKQSVKTFLNAMTFPDKTVYPASSMVEADYFNLMAVYGDAVFFPLLTEDTFRQEGHRFEFDQSGQVSIQGVVFNEMRGNYSTFDSIAGDWSLRSLLEGTPYAHDSGGDPADIPALTYEQFRAFHAKYYHPANCRVFLSGNIATERQLELLDSRFLSRFSAAPRPAPVVSVVPFDEPRRFDVPAPAAEVKDLSLVTAEVNWLLPDSTDPVTLMEANLVAEILLGHDGAPLNRALLESGLGEDIAPSTGLETEIRHICFSAGLRGISRDRVADFEGLVDGTIRALCDSGIPESEVETAVRSIEFSNREVRRSGGPFALTLMRRSLRGWIHGFGPSATLRYVPAFEEVKRRLAANPDYLVGLLRRWFIDNRHRAFVTVYPDPDYEKRLDECLAARARVFESSLSVADRERFLTEQRAFFARQQEVDSPEVLARIPHLSPAQLPRAVDLIETTISRAGEVPILRHEQPTNGIGYADIAIPVDGLSVEEYPYLPLFSSILTGMGLDGLSWVETSALSARLTGGLGTMLFTSSAVPNPALPPELPAGLAGRDFLVIRVKMLAELIDDALSLAFRFLASADFSDRRRLADLLLEYRNDLDSSIAPSGHQYAVSRAACVTGRSRAVDEIWNGLAQVDFVRKQSAHIRNAAFASDLIARLDRIRGQLTAAGMVVNLTGSPDVLDAMQSAVARRADGFALRAPLDAASLPDGSAFRDRAALLALARDSVFGHDSREGGSSSGTPTTTAKAASLELIASAVQVGFAAAVLPSPRYGTPEQPVDIVLGHWLASGPLWEKIRTTGGAYGVFAYPDSLEDIFVFSTYRDPQPLQALKTFRDTLEAVARDAIDPISLEKAITGCYSREIQPRAPADKGFTAFIRVLYGISDDLRLAKLRRMLELSPVDISLAAQRLLSDLDVAHCAVLAGKKQLKGADKAEFPGNVTRYTV